MAVTLNTVWYANYGNGTSTGYYAVTQWAASTAVAAGVVRRQLATPTTGNERCFICIVAGTTGATEPTWTVTKGAKTTDNTVTWQECTGRPAVNADTSNTPLSSANRSGSMPLGLIIQNNAGTYFFLCSTAGTSGSTEPTYNTTTGSTTTDGTATWTCIGATGSFGKWAAPHNRTNNAVLWSVSGDTIYLSSIHAETNGAAITINGGTTGLTGLYCIGQTGNIPPQSADLTTGASISTTTTFAITLQGLLDIVGVAFSAGSGTSNNTTMNVASTGYYQRLTNCSLSLPSTGSNATLTIGTAVSRVLMINTPISFAGASGPGIYNGGGYWEWRSTPGALTFSTAPTVAIYNNGSQHGGVVFFEGVDLSGFNGSSGLIRMTNGASRFVLSGCKLPTLPIAVISSTIAQTNSAVVDVVNCDSGGVTARHERWANEGTHVTDMVAVRTAGASDGTTPISWQLSVLAGASWAVPFMTMPIAVWNAVTGSTVNLTVEAAYNGAALPTNDQIWIEASYFATASSTILSRASGSKANILASGTALTASTAAWDSQAAARVNSNAYTVGQYIKVASNAGRLFICTAAGTSAASEPAGYASALDGGSVTDGTATFRALVRFKLTLALSSPTPQEAGYIRVYPKAALASSTLWIDPLVTLS